MIKERLMHVLIKPIVTEKSSTIADKHRQITFRVASDASKPEVKAAVEQLFKVEVSQVRIINTKGKVKTHGRFVGRKKSWKKAYVSLKEGFDINFAQTEAK